MGNGVTAPQVDIQHLVSTFRTDNGSNIVKSGRIFTSSAFHVLAIP